MTRGIRIRLPDFDMGEMRAIQYKQEQTGFITADELMQLQKAGLNGPERYRLNRNRKTDEI
jgi:hypothetical protein